MFIIILRLCPEIRGFGCDADAQMSKLDGSVKTSIDGVHNLIKRKTDGER